MTEPALDNNEPTKSTVQAETKTETESSPSEDVETALKPFLSVPFEVSIELGRSKLKIRDLLRLRRHSIVELEKAVGGNLDICINGTLVGRGEPVVLENRVQIKVDEIFESNE